METLILRGEVFQEFDSDNRRESKSTKSIDEKEAEVETQFGTMKRQKIWKKNSQRKKIRKQ